MLCRHFDECPQAGPLPPNERVFRRWQQANIVPQGGAGAAAATLAAAGLSRHRAVQLLRLQRQ